MINISPEKYYNDKDTNGLPNLEKVDGIIIYCDPIDFIIDGNTAYTLDAREACKKENVKYDELFHFAINSGGVLQCLPTNKQTNHLRGHKLTYIENSLYKGNTNGHTIAVRLFLPKDGKMDNIERIAVKLIATLLKQYNLSIEKLWRGFDLNKYGSPLHLLDSKLWDSFLMTVGIALDSMNKGSYNDSVLESLPPVISDDDARALYFKYSKDPLSYSKRMNIDDRNIKEAMQEVDESNNAMQSYTTAQKNTFQYVIQEIPPVDRSHCTREYDAVTAKITAKALEVEPIYPDLTVPPGGTLTVVDKVEATTTQVTSSTTLSPEDFEKRSKSFNVRDYKDAVKEVSGKPVNNNDPFPVDDKIKELESHVPKVKIDRVEFMLYDCNHPDSIIGPEVAKNFAMLQDEVISMSRRVEHRLSKIENNMATMMRNLWRSASRMNINCVYYGGQDVFGKYKCIRCTHTSRVDDGQSMTLDQCLSCTRYEPIIGQIYAILDESGTNVSQVIDDIQMSFSDLQGYAELTRLEEMHNERVYADLTKDSKVPDPLSKVWDDGFKMDWSYTTLESQRPSIAEYSTEGIEPKKHVPKLDNQKAESPEWKDRVEETDKVEFNNYLWHQYEFKEFGTPPGVNRGGQEGQNVVGSGTASEARKVIVDYAQNALKLCLEGKAGYSNSKRYNNGESAENGFHYWDCSSLVQKAYEAAGISGIGTYTVNMYPHMLEASGGELIPIDQIDNAKPGDMIWFTAQRPKPSTGSWNNAKHGDDGIGHVAIYIGDGKYIHATHDTMPKLKQILLSPLGQDPGEFAFGRPKALIEMDKNAPMGGGEHEAQGKISIDMCRVMAAWEGFSAVPYTDTGKVWTIGHGITQSWPDQYNSLLPSCTEEQSWEAMRQIAQHFADGVWSKVKAKGWKYKQCEFDVLVALCYGGGMGAWDDLLDVFPDGRITREKYTNFYVKDMAGNRLLGLINRRHNEMDIWEGGEYKRNR